MTRCLRTVSLSALLSLVAAMCGCGQADSDPRQREIRRLESEVNQLERELRQKSQVVRKAAQTASDSKYKRLQPSLERLRAKNRGRIEQLREQIAVKKKRLDQLRTRR